MTNRKGIILAEYSGTRLFPVTMGISKQLLPIYNKPTIYYPLSVLMLTDIREVAVITTPEDQAQFIRLLGDGPQWAYPCPLSNNLSPAGLAQAYILADRFLNGAPSAMVLGHNIFFAHGLTKTLSEATKQTDDGTVFGYQVSPIHDCIFRFVEKATVGFGGKVFADKIHVIHSNFGWITMIVYAKLERTSVLSRPGARRAKKMAASKSAYFRVELKGR